jgi:excisionase family DNA binding protein
MIRNVTNRYLMSSKIQVQRICEFCSKEFMAKTTVTRFCSLKCASKAHKQMVRNRKVVASEIQTIEKKNQPIEDLKGKEFLTVREVSRLLNCSIRSAYYYIESGSINSVNLGQRITRVKRSDIDKLFEHPKVVLPQKVDLDITECYSISEIYVKYGISATGLQNLIKRHQIPKIKKGWFVYVSKVEIDKYLK